MGHQSGLTAEEREARNDIRASLSSVNDASIDALQKIYGLQPEGNTGGDFININNTGAGIGGFGEGVSGLKDEGLQEWAQLGGDRKKKQE